MLHWIVMQLVILELLVFLKYVNSGYLSTRIYNNRDDFNFEIINFRHSSTNILTSVASGIYISHLIWYPKACSCYSDFLKRHHWLRCWWTMILSKNVTCKDWHHNMQCYHWHSFNYKISKYLDVLASTNTWNNLKACFSLVWIFILVFCIYFGV